MTVTSDPEANKQIVRQLLDEVVTEGNVDLIDDLFAEDVTDHTLAGDTHGREPIKERAEALHAAFSGFSATIELLIAEDDTVALLAIDRGTHDGEFMGIDPTGREVEYPATAFFRMEDGKIIERWVQPDLFGLLQQLGVVDPPADVTERTDQTSTTHSPPLSVDAIDDLTDRFRGEVLLTGDEGYDEARTIWNAMIDRKPAVIARCADTADVIAAVDFAREHDLLMAVKGGGHNVAGNAVCDGGLMIDLSLMTSVRVDPGVQTARVEPGARMADLDHETDAFGLVVPGGIVSDTGVAGLTLGGGFGWLCRKYGLSIDNLRSVDIVTADGQLRHASETENPDLFWGVRGGGGNFGVVTSFEFDCHGIDDVLAGLVVYPVADAPTVLRHWHEFIADAPEDLSVWGLFFTAPEEPFIPEAYHGRKVVAIAPVYSGDTTEGEYVIAPLRSFGDPIADTIEPWSFVEWQQAFDDGYPEGDRYYWKSHNFRSPPGELFDVIAEYAQTLPTPETRVSMTHLGGAVNRVELDETAYPHRDTEFLVNITTRWQDPTRDDECIAWTREYFDALAEYATGGTYVNLISEREGEESMAYRENYDRLVELKNEWDPQNLFRMNQNVEPTV